MKICRGCNKMKPLSGFYEKRGMADGHLNFCKECVCKKERLRREGDLERIREYDRIRNKVRLKNPAFKLYRVEYMKNYRTPKITKAHNSVNRKLQSPEACEICGSEVTLHGHHNDYDNPLDVVWCCPLCHKAIHKDLEDRGVNLHRC